MGAPIAGIGAGASRRRRALKPLSPKGIVNMRPALPCLSRLPARIRRAGHRTFSVGPSRALLGHVPIARTPGYHGRRRTERWREGNGLDVTDAQVRQRWDFVGLRWMERASPSALPANRSDILNVRGAGLAAGLTIAPTRPPASVPSPTQPPPAAQRGRPTREANCGWIALKYCSANCQRWVGGSDQLALAFSSLTKVDHCTSTAR